MKITSRMIGVGIVLIQTIVFFIVFLGLIWKIMGFSHWVYIVLGFCIISNLVLGIGLNHSEEDLYLSWID